MYTYVYMAKIMYTLYLYPSNQRP